MEGNRPECNEEERALVAKERKYLQGQEREYRHDLVTYPVLGAVLVALGIWALVVPGTSNSGEWTIDAILNDSLVQFGIAAALIVFGIRTLAKVSGAWTGLQQLRRRAAELEANPEAFLEEQRKKGA